VILTYLTENLMKNYFRQPIEYSRQESV